MKDVAGRFYPVAVDFARGKNAHLNLRYQAYIEIDVYILIKHTAVSNPS